MKNQNPIKMVIITGAFLVLLVAVFFTGLFMTPPSQDYNDDAFNETFNHILNAHYSSPEESALWEGAINGLIHSLDDPFSRYFDEEAFSQFREGFKESYVGIGVTVEDYDNQVLIRYVWPSSPAENGGLQAGDIIIEIDGVSYQDKSFAETTAALLGEEGSEVSIGYERPGIEGINRVTLTRETIDNPSVDAEIYQNDAHDIGVISIHTFGDETAEHVETILDDFTNEGIDALVIDLRDNGGGGLSSLLDILDLFVSKGSEPLFSIELMNRDGIDKENYYAKTDVSLPFPITVLINEQSASASEVFASAMQEYAGYTVIGQPSYGKGTLQSSIALNSIDGNYVHLTIGVWKTSDGNWVDRNGGTNGVQPDLLVEQNPVFAYPNLFLSEDEMYAYDEVSSKIKQAQDILLLLGYDIRNDGYFDMETMNAIISFQQSESIDDTGLLDDVTAILLSERLNEYKQNPLNDDQLQAAINYLIGEGND
ncbi:MAG: S41 family peptidase [Candidatus Izemoplasmataceae bacterium]